MSYLVKSRNLHFSSKDNVNVQSIGNYYSGDRFYTLLNEYIDVNLKRKSKTISFFIKYIFSSSNYKHDPSIANGKSIGIKLLDWFCYLCIIGFLIMFATVIGGTFADAKKLSESLSGAGFTSVISNFGQAFVDGIGKNITMLVFGVIFLVVSIWWMVMYFRFRKKNSKLTLKDYVIKKMEFCLKSRFILKIVNSSKKAAKKIKKNNNNEMKIFYLEKFESQGGPTDRWLNLQMINLIASIFNDFNIIFKFDNLTDDEYIEFKNIFSHDFKMIDIIKI